MSDEADRQDLEDRVEQLESTISKMLPSRRDALKLGGAALVGGAAMSGTGSAGTQQAGTIGTSGAPVDVELEDINPGSTRAVEFNQNDITGVSALSTAEAETTGETFIRATRSTTSSTTNAGVFTNCYDSESRDNRDEFNSSAQINVDKTGEYHLNAYSEIQSSDGDRLEMRVQNVTDGSTLFLNDGEADGSLGRMGIHQTVSLDSSKLYEIQGRNLIRSFEINVATTTVATIKRSIVQ